MEIREIQDALIKLGIKRVFNPNLDCQIFKYNKKYHIKISKRQNGFNVECITVNNNRLIA